MQKDIMPENTPNIYDGEKWVSLYDFVEISEGNVPKYTEFFYIVFISQYLNRESVISYDLFSIAVCVMKGIIYLNNFNHYGIIMGGNTLYISELPNLLQQYDYFDGIDLEEIYYLGEIESHKELTDEIVDIATHDVTNKNLAFYVWG